MSPDLELDPRPLAHLPLVRAVIDQLQIGEVLEELLPMDPRSRVSEADCVVLMLLNILEGRVALYNMEDWLARTDWEVLLGPDCPPDAFNDARLAACLDRIAELGTEEILSAVVQRYLARPDTPSEYTAHGDTTSIALQGAYTSAYQQGSPAPAYGFSKDLRPDLKQLVFGLTLHGSAGIPLTSTMFAGNTSDHHANRLNLDQLSDLLPKEDEVTVVGDCKLVDAQTIGQLLLHEFHFVSLLPSTYRLRAQLIEGVRSSGEELPELLRSPGRTLKDPPRIYRGRSFQQLFTVGFDSQGDNDVRQVSMRFLVVESTQLAEEEEAALERKLASESKTFATALRAVSRRKFACEADAQIARDKLVSKLVHHRAHIDIMCEETPKKRASRGRPKAGEPREMEQIYRLVESECLEPDAEAVERLRFHARHFVLITDHLDEQAWPDARILSEYRHQHVVEGHTGFRWLKNVGTVAPVFLHTPHRIAALGLVLVLALMVRNYFQFTLRRRLSETASTVPDRLGKPTEKPTAETAFLPFAPVQVVRIRFGAQLLERRLTPLDDDARTVLRMLEVNERVFITPRPPRLNRGGLP